MRTTREARIADAFVDEANARTIDLSGVEKGIGMVSARSTIESFDANDLAVTVEPGGKFTGEGIVYFQVPARNNNTMGEELLVSFDGRMDEASGRITFDNVAVDVSTLTGPRAIRR